MPSPFIPAPHQEPSALSAYTGASFGSHSGGGAHDSLKALTRIVASLKRFRWLILALSLAGLGGGILATRFIKPEYEVQASVWIEAPSSRASNTGPIQG